MNTRIEIPVRPRAGQATVTVQNDSGTFTGRYEGVGAAASYDRSKLTLSGVPIEHGGSTAKGWLSIPLGLIASHTFRIQDAGDDVPILEGRFTHVWTPND